MADDVDFNGVKFDTWDPPMPEDDLVKRVAQAIYQSIPSHVDDDLDPSDYATLARAAIESMFHPTRAMNEAGGAYLNSPASEDIDPEEMSAKWRAMIKTALGRSLD